MAHHDMELLINSIPFEATRNKHTYNDNLFIKELIPIVADNKEMVFDGYIHPYKASWYQDENNPSDDNELSLMRETRHWDMFITFGSNEDKPRREPDNYAYSKRRF